MTTSPQQAEPLRRPPIRQATTVRSDVEHTFTVFVREIGTWWPTSIISAGQDRVRAAQTAHIPFLPVHVTAFDQPTLDAISARLEREVATVDPRVVQLHRLYDDHHRDARGERPRARAVPDSAERLDQERDRSPYRPDRER